MPRLYLDNAATSFPKAPGVYEAMLRFGREVGASPGRGQYTESRDAAAVLRRCRERLNTLIGGESPDHIIFTLNTTDALNLAIKGVARRRRLLGLPSHIITTAMDHNSVLRPLHALAEEGVRVEHIAADAVSGLIDPAAIARAITPETALVALNMVSNVAGTIQPTTEIGMVCRHARPHVPLLADAAQALGHIPVDVRTLGVDFLAFPGHKGLLGPQGTGGLYVRPGAEHLLATTREGGTGSWSETDGHPTAMPERFEAGSHNTIGIAGLSEATAWMLGRGVASLREHELALIDVFLDDCKRAGLRHPDWPALDGPLACVRLLGPSEASARVGVFALVHDHVDPHDLAVVLETEFGILARAGLACAPGAHRTFDTLGGGGALRLSIGPFTTEADIRYAAASLARVCEAVTA